ncbi:MAG: helix-turn-helix transcriptional regulator [Chloroflexi bacterium]|nr:helix-turn-helix transcriptional regulator [Chloroflexota bacterium]
MSDLPTNDRVRIGEAAEALGVSTDTLRRWIAAGRVTADRTEGGQRTLSRGEVNRLLAERRKAGADRPIVAQSARNRFPGVVTEVKVDGVAATVEVQAGPHRLLSLLTREAVDELGLAPGSEVVCVVKATSVIVEVPS